MQIDGILNLGSKVIIMKLMS